MHQAAINMSAQSSETSLLRAHKVSRTGCAARWLGGGSRYWNELLIHRQQLWWTLLQPARQVRVLWKQKWKISRLFITSVLNVRCFYKGKKSVLLVEKGATRCGLAADYEWILETQLVPTYCFIRLVPETALQGSLPGLLFALTHC